MTRPRILITRRWPERVERELCARFDVTRNESDTPMTPAEFRAAFQDHDAVLPTVTDPLDAEAFDIPSARTRILANYGVGYSHIDTARAADLGMVVTNTPDVLSDCTADIAMTLLLMAARRAGEGERELRAGDWTGWRPTHLVGTKVTGKTLGLIGFGRIGQEMARRAHFGFGMRIRVQNRSAVDPAILGRFGATQVNSVAEMLPDCDFVSLHCPGGAANRHLIGAEQLARMKPGAILVNTARGEVVDEDALAQALTAGALGGAGLDVFDGEPRINPALLRAPGLVLLPHLGSATRETREGMGMQVLRNLTDFFDGKTPPDRVV